MITNPTPEAEAVPDLVDWFGQYVERYIETNGPDQYALIAVLDRVRDSYRRENHVSTLPQAGEEARLTALLEGRDAFIVSKDLWPEFVDTLPKHPGPRAPQAGEPSQAQEDAKPWGWWVEHKLAEGGLIRDPAYCPTGQNYKVTPLYTHPAPVQPDAGDLREAIIGVVDPLLIELEEALMSARGEPANLRDQAARNRDGRREKATAKADAILALTGTQQAKGEGWRHPDAVPQVKAGCEAWRIVAVRRAHNGQIYSFPATYLNQYVLRFEDENEERPVTGWFSAVTGEDGEGESYHELLAKDDELMAWRDLPPAPSADVLAALMSETKG